MWCVGFSFPRLEKLSATLSLKRVPRRCDTPNHAGYHSIGHCSLRTPLRMDQKLHHSAVGPPHVPVPERPYPIGSVEGGVPGPSALARSTSTPPRPPPPPPAGVALPEPAVIGCEPQRRQLPSVASDAAPSHHERSAFCANLRIQSPPPSIDERRLCQRRVANVEGAELRQRRQLLQAVDKTEAGFDVQDRHVLQVLQRLEAPFERQTRRQVQTLQISGNVGVAGDCTRTPQLKRFKYSSVPFK